MPKCETCGNDYDKTFDVVVKGKSHTFDSFECAIHALAPSCKHCGIRIIGHGLEKDGTFFAAITAPKRKASAACATASSALVQRAHWQTARVTKDCTLHSPGSRRRANQVSGGQLRSDSILRLEPEL
jgi:hypothetical protein